MTGGVWPPGSKEFSMRKALIGLILAATAMVPAVASAQRHHNDGGGDGNRGSWSGRNNGNGGNGGESRAARSEARQEARQQRQSQPQAQQQPQQQQQVVVRQRGDGGGSRGNWNRGGSNNGGGERANWNRGGGGDGDRRVRNNQQSVYPQAWQGNPNDPRLQRYRQLEQRNQNGGDRGNWRNGRNDRNDNNWRDGRRGDNRNRRGDWNRGWRNDNRYNWSSWRNQNRGRYHLSPYYSPYRNWSYRRISIGLFLDSLFYDQRYWIGNPYEYRLPPAPYGTQWVRYYDDVILVDVYSGEVLDVIYDFFW